MKTYNMGSNESVQCGILQKTLCKKNFDSRKAVGRSVAFTLKLLLKKEGNSMIMV